MNTVGHTWVEEQLNVAEREKRCVTARTRCERERMRKAVKLGLAIEVLPAVFVRKSYWQELKVSAQARHKMKALHELHSQFTFAGPSAALAHGLWVSNRYLTGDDELGELVMTFLG